MLTLCIAGWVLAIAGVESEIQTEVWGRAAFVTASLIPATFLAFSRVFPATSRWPTTTFLWVAFILGSALAVLSAATRLVAYDISVTDSGIRRTSGPLFPIFA